MSVAGRRLSGKGQVTLPKAWRDLMGIKAGDRVRLVVEGGKCYISGVQQVLPTAKPNSGPQS